MSLPTTPSPTTTLAAPGLTTPALKTRPQLTEAQFQKFAELVYELSGMRFEANKSYFLASKLDVRVQALNLRDFDHYMSFLNSPAGRTEYGHLVDEVSINETFFYRHEPQLQAFQQEILMPMVFARKTQRQLKFRIWSAAASTGDELYTLALMIKEAGLLNQGMTFELVGTDISHEALSKARAGVYRKYNVRNIPPAVLQQNFKHNPADDTWVINPDIKAMCKFQEMNLMESARTQTLGKFDVIFVRNVLIYFDEPSKEKVVTNLATNLVDDGVIVLGHSENVYGQRHIIKQDKNRSASIAYIKAPPGTPKY